MNQDLKKNRFNSASLRGSRSAHTVLVRMAADESRAARVRDLYQRRKAEDPRFTWRKIAEHVGVSERAAHAWGKTGGIDPENVEKLAEILGTDEDYIWRGPQPETPDLMAAVDGRGSDGLARIQKRLEQLEIAVDKQNENLQEQTKLLAEIREERKAITTALQNIEALIATAPSSEEVAELRRAIDGDG